jgi:uncharacterized protein YndB with AHSA1/START domain
MTNDRHDRPSPDERPDADAPVTETTIDASMERVWGAVVDATTYPQWLVGAQQIRATDDDWPEPGSSFHHTVGAGPLRLRDRTEVVSIDPPHQLVLRAYLSMFGSATVTIDVDDQSPHRTRLRMTEAPASGIMRTLWRLGGRQALRLTLWGRNVESLEQLKDGIEQRRIEGSPT